MSRNGSTTARLSATPMSTPEAYVNNVEAAWAQTNKRRNVNPSRLPSACAEPARMTSLPDWPGKGIVHTDCDVLPMVTIEGMPASEYPKYMLPLTMYSLADLVTVRPHLFRSLQSTEARLMALIVTATRAGSWAALGRVPLVSRGASSTALRWSSRLGALVTTSAQVGDGTDLWRQFLASCQGFSSSSSSIATALAGVAQLQFLLGAALCHQSGEVYAMHLMQREVSAHLKAVLAPQDLLTLHLESNAVWQTMGAAAIGGFRASVIKHLCSDVAFTLSAHLRIADTDRAELQGQLDGTMQRVATSYRGFPHSSVAPAGMEFESATADDDDTQSVADTVAELDEMRSFEPAASGASTPRAVPDLDENAAASLREAIAAVPPMTPAWGSIARMAVDNDSVPDF